MSHIAIRRALEQRLHTMVPALATAWENASFRPTSGVAYQIATLVPAVSENPTMDKRFTRELGFYQVQLMYPIDEGTQPMEARFELLKARFPGGLTITQDGVTVTISGTVYRSGPAFRDGDRWALTARIPYFANIS